MSNNFLTTLQFDLDFANQIAMIHINTRSMVNKFDEIKTLLSTTVKWNFIFVSETWLTKDIEKFYLLEGYQSFFASRANKPGGGSAIYVQGNIEAKQLPLFLFTTAEVVSLKVKINKQKQCVLIQIYRAPKNNSEFLSELEQCLINANKLNILTYIVGDFNANLFSLSNNTFNESFFTLMCSYGFLPVISKATRVSTESCTLIDNIFCNDISIINHSGVIETDLSDHFAIFSSTIINIERKPNAKESKECFDYHYIENLNEFLVSELENYESETNPESACNKLIESYTKGIKNSLRLNP